MTKRLSFSKEAVRDLDDVWNYTFRTWGRDQAWTYVNDLEAQARLLLEESSAPREVTIRGLLYRRIRFKSHAIYARDLNEQVRVIRILHVRQDVNRQLR